MFEHPSGLPYAFDRARDQPQQKAVVFYGRRPFIQGAELNELQTILRAMLARLGGMVAGDGDRIEGADVRLDGDTASLSAGRIYIAGDVLPVAAATIEDVPTVGRTTIGVRRVTTYVTHEQDEDLRGMVPGEPSEGEPGAARECVTIAWALQDDEGEGEGDYYPVYAVQDGTVIDQIAPPALDGIMQALALYDRPHGSYVVDGMRVTALGSAGGAQVFDIGAGEANIFGFKVQRQASMRVAQEEDWDTETIAGETHIYPDAPSHTFSVLRAPIDTINQILLTKEVTEDITRGGIAHGADALPHTGVIEIVSIAGYTQGVDYTRVGNSVDWALAGAEPAGGASYSVTYRYRSAVSADASSATTITVSGGAEDGEIIVTYTSKLPRVDRLCLDRTGAPVYLKGVSAPANPWPPVVPVTLLSLATITNDWMSTPAVQNTDVIFVDEATHRRGLKAVENLTRLVMHERIQTGINARDTVATRGMFVDPLLDDSTRDQGEAQTAAISDGRMELPIAVTVHLGNLSEPATLVAVEEIVVAQELVTGCVKINEYQNFTPQPASVRLTPRADFWTETQTAWTSPLTQEFSRGTAHEGSPLEVVSETAELVGRRQEAARFLRQIDITVSIVGFGAGETLDYAAFDGIDITPADEAADEDGELSFTFAVPANVSAGTKLLTVLGGGGTWGQASFAGGGAITIETMRRVTTIERWNAPPVVSVQVSPTPAPAPGPMEPPAFVQPGFDWFAFTMSSGEAEADPQAQIFAVPATRQLLGIDFRLCGIGDTSNQIVVHQVGVEAGLPAADPVAEAVVSMAGAAVGWKAARYHLPVTTPTGRQHAFVVKTDDGDHSISVARLGSFDAAKQQWVTRHPYTAGPRATSLTARNWSLVQEEALAFRLIAARYPVTTRTIELGEIDLEDTSDLKVVAAVELPSSDCSVVFEIERANGTIYRLLPGQRLKLTEYLTETVEWRAVLTGTEQLSPILYAPVQLHAGSIAASFTYVSRAFAFGEDVDPSAYFYAYLPGGATVAVHYDKADDDWQAMSLGDQHQLAWPQWSERRYDATGVTAVQGRIRITATGGPAARVEVGQLGAALRV